MIHKKDFSVTSKYVHEPTFRTADDPEQEI